MKFQQSKKGLSKRKINLSTSKITYISYICWKFSCICICCIVWHLLVQMCAKYFKLCYMLFRAVQLQYYSTTIWCFLNYLLSLLLQLSLFLDCFCLETRVYQKQPLYLTYRVEVRNVYTLPSQTLLCGNILCISLFLLAPIDLEYFLMSQAFNIISHLPGKCLPFT